MGDQVTGCFEVNINFHTGCDHCEKHWCGEIEPCPVPGVAGVLVRPPAGQTVVGPFNQRLTAADLPATFQTGSPAAVWELLSFDSSKVVFNLVTFPMGAPSFFGTACAVID